MRQHDPRVIYALIEHEIAMKPILLKIRANTEVARVLGTYKAIEACKRGSAK